MSVPIWVEILPLWINTKNYNFQVINLLVICQCGSIKLVSLAFYCQLQMFVLFVFWTSSEFEILINKWHTCIDGTLFVELFCLILGRLTLEVAKVLLIRFCKCCLCYWFQFLIYCVWMLLKCRRSHIFKW